MTKLKLMLLIGVPLVAIVAGVSVWKITSRNNQSQNRTNDTSSQSVDPSVENDKKISEQKQQESQQTKSKNPTKLKSIGFNFGLYDPATKTAGDIKFTNLTQPGSEIWIDFGIQDIRSPNDPTKKNPQPTFILPLGTPVLSLIDGTVMRVEKLYSGDYTIMTSPEGSDLMYELEHVNNPKVKEGDIVTAGQVVAEVSTHDSQYHPGFGILEIGILKGGNPPQHLCPFNYLDDSIKDDINKKILALYRGWEEYRGKTDIYDEAKYPIPGCATLEPANG